tara:strand:- start:25 stop:156 length:132 start_codon:yes stop_codon:yes gene_type:complete
LIIPLQKTTLLDKFYIRYFKIDFGTRVNWARRNKEFNEKEGFF